MHAGLLTVLRKLWNSPTFTTWGNQAVQALRLLAVTPLILRSFDVTEIAAWYLFGSITFLGSLVSQRVGLTFSRMIAFAMGGADDLSPIKGKPIPNKNTTPRWGPVERAYATTGALNALLTVAIILLAVLMGWYGLEKILSEYESPQQIWTALAVMIASQAVVFFFQQFSVALRGMNFVPLVNRWEIVFSLLSIAAGLSALLFGGGILTVTIAMQIVVVLSVLRNRCLLRYVQEGRFRRFKSMAIDRQMISWAWEPAWKGFIVTLANSGGMQMAAIISARFMDVEDMAATLLSLRLLAALKSVSNAPFFSHMPLISRMLASGEHDQLRRLISRRIFICQFLFIVCALVLVLFGGLLLALIKANATLLPPSNLIIISLLILLQNFILLSLMLSSFGNHIVCVKHEISTFLISSLLLYILIPLWGVAGLIVGLFIPSFIILNLIPARIAADKLEMSLWRFCFRSTAYPVLIMSVATAILIAI